jgi:cytochrome c-type biogenesis protein
MEIDAALLNQGTLLAFGLVFLGGIVTSIGPCNLATVPLLVGYVGGTATPGRGRALTLSLAFAIGLATTFMLLGVAAALVGKAFTGLTNWGYYLLAAVCFVLALVMLGALDIQVPAEIVQLRTRIGWKGLPGAFVLGLVSGLVASQCATPVLLAILTYVMVQQAAIVYGAALLFVYALGRGVPIVLAGTFTGVLKQMRQAGSWSKALEVGSAVLLAGIGLYFLWLA